MKKSETKEKIVLDSFLTYKNIEDIGYKYTQTPFPNKENRNHPSEQFFEFKVDKNNSYIISFYPTQTVTNLLLFSIDKDLFKIDEQTAITNYFLGYINSRSQLMDIILMCGAPWSEKLHPPLKELIKYKEN